MSFPLNQRKAPRALQLAAAVIKDGEGNYLIHKRPSKGLLANLWEFPNIEVDLSIAPDHQQLQAFIQNEYGADIKIHAPLPQFSTCFLISSGTSQYMKQSLQVISVH